METNNYFTKLLGRSVKVLYTDDGKTKIVIGILNEANTNFIVVNDVIIGVGTNFISCIPREDNNDSRY